MKLLILFLFVPFVALANGRGGNGGTSLECTNILTGKPEIILWDLIEYGQMRFSRPINKLNNPYAEADRILREYEKVDPMFAIELQDEYRYYLTVVSRHQGEWDISDYEIGDIRSDYRFPGSLSGYISCKKVYPAYFIVDYPVLFASYYINEAMMKRMSYEHQVALIIHEVVYALFMNKAMWDPENNDLDPEAIVLLAPQVFAGGVKDIRSKVRKIMGAELIMPSSVPYPSF